MVSANFTPPAFAARSDNRCSVGTGLLAIERRRRRKEVWSVNTAEKRWLVFASCFLAGGAVFLGGLRLLLKKLR